MTNPLDLFGALFDDADVAAVLSADAHVAAMLRVEAALANALAEAGVIPQAAAETIGRLCVLDPGDVAALSADAGLSGNLVIPLVRRLTARVAAVDAEAATHVHRGATSQDVADTAVVLQMRDAVTIVRRRLARTSDAAAALARRHASTPMCGRTWLQQASPVTFGLKAAGWVDALDRTGDALERAAVEASTLQFGGATGTLAALGASADAVVEGLARALALHVADVPWHAHRDRLVQLACQLAIVAGVLGKIARDVSLLAQTEVGEVSEGSAPGRGGSSTMPQKRNPVRAAVVLSAATRAPGLAATMLAAMPQEHERGLGGWQAEWTTLPLLVGVVAGSARAGAELLETLEIDTSRMRANLSLDGGLVMAEALSTALSTSLGKAKAHAIVEDVARRARAEGRELADVAADTEAIASLDRDRLRELLAPDRYLGSSSAFVARVLARHDARRAAPKP